MNLEIHEIGLHNKSAVVSKYNEETDEEALRRIGINQPIPVSRAKRSIIKCVLNRQTLFDSVGYEQVKAFLFLLNVYNLTSNEELDKFLQITLDQIDASALRTLVKILEQIETSDITFSVPRDHYLEIRELAFQLWTYLVRYCLLKVV